jgi:hypothetical protein
VATDDRHVTLGLGQILVRRPVDVSAAQRAADAELGTPAADQVLQASLAVVA